MAEILLAAQSEQGAVRALLEESLALSREMGDKGNMAICFFLLGDAALQQSDTTTARSLAEQSLELFKEMGDQGWTAQSLALLGTVNVVQGDYTAARALYEESLTFPLGGDASFLEGLAGVVAAQGELTWAAHLWGAAEVLREAICAPRPPFERVRYERAVAAARAQLGEKAFAATWAEGRTMTPEQALAAQGSVTLPQPLPTAPSSTSPAKPAATYPDGLTTREVEVLRLLAQGLTHAQIAEQLVISPRTVNNHLTSIYSKIQVTSRSAATRYAVEHQLV